jgi:hypothetical protein
MSNANTPHFYVYTIRERDKGQKPIWTRLGAAWKHQDSPGITIELEAVPLKFTGKLVLLPPREAEAETAV